MKLAESIAKRRLYTQYQQNTNKLKMGSILREWQDSALNKISAAVGVCSLVGVYLLAKHNACYETSLNMLAHMNVKTFEKFFKF